MSHHKRSQEAIKRRKDIQAQKSASRTYIKDNEFTDLVNREKVNMVTQDDIKTKLKKDFEGGYLLGAVPDVEHSQVLEMPNVYHFELFPQCNEFEVTEKFEEE